MPNSIRHGRRPYMCITLDERHHLSQRPERHFYPLSGRVSIARQNPRTALFFPPFLFLYFVESAGMFDLREVPVYPPATSIIRQSFAASVTRFRNDNQIEVRFRCFWVAAEGRTAL